MQNLAESLSNVKLRSTKISHDASAPKLSGFLGEAEAKQYQTTCLDINIEEWFDLIPEHTFKTAYVELSIDDGRRLSELFPRFEREGEAMLTAPDVAAFIDRIEKSLQPAVSTVGSPFFLKLSSRSPKDAVVRDPAFPAKYRAHLAAKQGTDEGTQLASLLEAGATALQMESARLAVELCVRSERVHQDMLLALDHAVRWRENFVLREWVDLPVDMEFRGFVHRGSLNAISQYNHLCYFPDVAASATEIGSRIASFFTKQIQARLAPKFDSYVIDFAVCQDKIWVIELNPFLSTTDGSLFSWETEQSILENGPLQIRVRQRPVTGARALISNEWRNMLSLSSCDT